MPNVLIEVDGKTEAVYEDDDYSCPFGEQDCTDVYRCDPCLLDANEDQAFSEFWEDRHS